MPFGVDAVTVDVRLRRRKLVCPYCGWSTRARHNMQRRPSTWRVWVRATLRRLDYPDTGWRSHRSPSPATGRG